jgi:phosphopantothenoylcysteine decarboxylase/phosphopantothenate--cysteine ligase
MSRVEKNGASPEVGRVSDPPSAAHNGEGGSKTRPTQILFIVSGSIACYKACDAISQLVQRGHRVRTIVTAAGLRFVGASTLEGLTGEKVATDLFESGAALDHVALARWADVVVVCPATANMLNRMAAGLADDLAGTVLLALDAAKPLVVAPAMNPVMWRHPATVAATATLRERGVHFILGDEGRTACGEVGEGRMAEAEAIVAAVEVAATRPAHASHVLITSGGTTEPIDGVRVLANTSTGATGALLADYFARRGHAVTLLRARAAHAAPAGCREVTFDSFADLDAALERELGEREYDLVIHAAAVSDFSVHAIEINGVARPPGVGKIGSDVAPVLKLRRNPKLLDSLRARSRNAAIRVVAFKLTRDAEPGEVRNAVGAMFAAGVADLVVHNDLGVRTAEAFPAEIWSPEGDVVARCANRAELAAKLEGLVNSGIEMRRSETHAEA